MSDVESDNDKDKGWVFDDFSERNAHRDIVVPNDGAGDEAVAGELSSNNGAKWKRTEIVLIVIDKGERGDVKRKRDIMGD